MAIPLNGKHIVLVRQNTTFNMRYTATTYILEKLNALIINNYIYIYIYGVQLKSGPLTKP